MSGSILIVEDDPDVSMLLRAGLEKHGWEVDAVSSAAAALERLRTVGADVVLTDVQMPGGSGIELCERLRVTYPETVPIVITGVANLDVAIAAIRAGAFDFILKPVSADLVAITVDRAIEHNVLVRELKRLRTDALGALDGIAGSSPAIRATMDLVRRVAETDATVLINGESGTGKELVARALHTLSPNQAQPFVAVNCAAMPPALLESELFGHVRGAFTDAKGDREGLFLQARSGTIFLDEIGEMPAEMQVKLLRVLQERTVRPVGSDQEFRVRARVVTATNRNLELEVERKRFREDLYYRINVVAISLPPLRERRDDILTLAQQFIKRSVKRSRKPVRSINPHAARALLDYDWPGNVRELENCIERAVAVCLLDEITIADLPDRLTKRLVSRELPDAAAVSELITLDEQERRYVRTVLAAVNGNKTRAARVLGIDRRSIYRRIEDLKEHETADI